jgi:L-amino acid N-acyltransferase YncA
MTEVRVAAGDDAAAILEIYAPIVRDTAISFETEVPTEEEMRRRIRETTGTYPWLVGERGGELVGYGYAHAFHPRAAYRWSVEVSMYVRADARASGVGTAIGVEMTRSLQRMGVVTIFGGTTVPNPASEAIFHANGFERVGVFPKVGFKLGRWHDVAWFVRRIAEPTGEPAELIPFSELPG